MANKVIDPRGADSSGIYRRPRLVLRLKRFEDLPSLLEKTKSYPTPVRMVGADYSQTRCVGGDGGTTVETGGLDRISEFDEHSVRAQAGVRVSTLVKALAERGQELPLTPEMGQISLGAMAVSTLPPTLLRGVDQKASSSNSSSSFVRANSAPSCRIKGPRRTTAPSRSSACAPPVSRRDTTPPFNR